MNQNNIVENETCNLGINQYDLKNNCMNLCKNDLKINKKTRLNDDQCYSMSNTQQSVSSGNYMLNNFHSCDCKMDTVISTATENPLMIFRDGYGVSDCVIDESSKLRVGKVRKYPKCTNQLFERPYITVPYMGRGSGNSKVESKLRPGEDTIQKKQCNTLSGIYIDNQFTPLVKNLKDNVQDPQNIIQEIVDNKWIRGGISSRQFVKDIDYLERCGDRIQNKNYIKSKLNMN